MRCWNASSSRISPKKPAGLSQERNGEFQKRTRRRRVDLPGGIWPGAPLPASLRGDQHGLRELDVAAAILGGGGAFDLGELLAQMALVVEPRLQRDGRDRQVGGGEELTGRVDA